MKSQNKAILEYLQKGKGISSFESFKKFKCTRLSARILDLKGLGHNITARWEGEGQGKYKVYRLEIKQ